MTEISFTENGFDALSKNDFYDFALYLLNEYSNEHFLFNCANMGVFYGKILQN